MNLPIRQIDAFSEGPFTGNPAAVVLLEAPIAPEQKRPDVRLDVRHPVASDGAEPSVSARPGAVPVGSVAAAVRVRVFTPSTVPPSTLAVVRAVAEVSAGNRAHA